MSARPDEAPVFAAVAESEPHRSAFLNPATDDLGPDEFRGDDVDWARVLRAAYQHYYAGVAAGAIVTPLKSRVSTPSRTRDQRGADIFAALRKSW